MLYEDKQDLLRNYNSPFPESIMVRILERVVPLSNLPLSRKDSAPISRKPCGRSSLMKQLTPDELCDADRKIRDLAGRKELLNNCTIQTCRTEVVPFQKDRTFQDLYQISDDKGGIVVCCQDIGARIKSPFHDKISCDVFTVGAVYSPIHLDLGNYNIFFVTH